MSVYVLVVAGVYDQGVIGVYASEQEAREAAEAIWPTTDGYHGFRIVPRVIGETHPDVFQRGWFSSSPKKNAELRIEVEA